MKKFLGTVAGLAALCGVAFAQEYKATSLQTPVGKISFGAWGRSTFEIGQEKQGVKITADPVGGAKTAWDGVKEAESTYDDYYESLTGAKPDKSDLDAYRASVRAAAETMKPGTGAMLDVAYPAYDQIAAQKAALEKDDSDTSNFIRLSPDWSYGCRVGFWIIGRTDDEHFGFDFNLDSDARALFVHKLGNANEPNDDDVNYNESGKYAVAIGDQAKMWGLFDTKPLQFKLALGKMRENELRGSIGDFGQRESSDVKSEDDIFQEFWPTTGLFVSAKGQKDTALEGFYMAGCVDAAGMLGLTNTDKDRDADGMGMGDIFHNGQYAVGYTVPGIMQVKAQYWGDSIKANNYRYAKSKYQTARDEGYDASDYLGRMEFGVDFLGLMGGASSIAEVDLDKTPNAALIELGVKVPLVTDNDLRAYDPEKFYNWYSCLGTMGVIQKGFIFYKGHIWGGQGESNLEQYSFGLVNLEKGKAADIVMAGFDALVEVCANPFGKQNVFLGCSGNWNITAANGEDSFYKDLELAQYKAGAEVYVKKTFGSNNYIFGGISYRYEQAKMDGTVNGLMDVSYEGTKHTIYAPIGIEMFF